MRLPPGAVVGRYRIDGLLAEGGMGVVYRACQVDLDLPVALKVIRPEWAHDEDFRARFKREARLAASLNHPHVVSPHDFGDHEGQLYVVMPLIDGLDLGAEIEHSGPLAPMRAAEVVGQVADALDVAHGSGLVHRDVKPANVLLVRRDKREHAYLTDFGVAKAIRSDTKLTQLGQLPGTPGYVSPEQINGDPLDGRTDVYSLGCVLCEALTGSVPYPRQTPAAMLIAHMTDAPPRISERVPDVPAGMDGVVSRALAKDPGERFGSAGELAEAARDAARGSAAAQRAVRAADAGGEAARRAPAASAEASAPVSAASAEASAPSQAAPSAAPGAAPPPEAAPARSARQRRGLVGAAAIVVTAMLAAFAGAWLQWQIADDSFDPTVYGDRAVVFVVFSALLTGLVAAVVAVTSPRAVRIGVAAAVGVGIGVLGGFLEAGFAWEEAPRRSLLAVWVIGGFATGFGATLVAHARRTVLIATVVGAIAAGLGAGLVAVAFDPNHYRGEDTFETYAAGVVIAAATMALGIALAIVREQKRAAN